MLQNNKQTSVTAFCFVGPAGNSACDGCVPELLLSISSPHMIAKLGPHADEVARVDRSFGNNMSLRMKHNRPRDKILSILLGIVCRVLKKTLGNPTDGLMVVV